MNVTPINQIMQNRDYSPKEKMGGGYPPNLPSNIENPSLPSYAMPSFPQQVFGTSNIHPSGMIIQESYSQPELSPCENVNFHIESCEYCRKKYDKSIHFFTNVILVLIIVYLLKRIIK